MGTGGPGLGGHTGPGAERGSRGADEVRGLNWGTRLHSPAGVGMGGIWGS